MNFILCMKKIITLGCFSGIALSIVLLGGSNISCNKPTDCKAIVTVLDSANNPVAGATVKLYSSNPPGQIQGQGSSDGSGNVTFDFKLPAIFDIAATKTTTKTMTGTGIVQLQIGQTVQATVNIK
jgi:hypothetical protein